MTRFGLESKNVDLAGLARDARRLATRGFALPGEVTELLLRIDRVRCLSGQPAMSPLRRWLDSLERLIGCQPLRSGTFVCGKGPRAGRPCSRGVAWRPFAGGASDDRQISIGR